MRDEIKKVVVITNLYGGKSINMRLASERLTRAQYMRLRRETKSEHPLHAAVYLYSVVCTEGGVGKEYTTALCNVVDRDRVCESLRVEELFSNTKGEKT